MRATTDKAKPAGDHHQSQNIHGPCIIEGLPQTTRPLICQVDRRTGDEAFETIVVAPAIAMQSVIIDENNALS